MDSLSKTVLKHVYDCIVDKSDIPSFRETSRKQNEAYRYYFTAENTRDLALVRYLKKHIYQKAFDAFCSYTGQSIYEEERAKRPFGPNPVVEDGKIPCISFSHAMWLSSYTSEYKNLPDVTKRVYEDQAAKKNQAGQKQCVDAVRGYFCGVRTIDDKNLMWGLMKYKVNVLLLLWLFHMNILTADIAKKATLFGHAVIYGNLSVAKWCLIYFNLNKKEINIINRLSDAIERHPKNDKEKMVVWLITEWQVSLDQLIESKLLVKLIGYSQNESYRAILRWFRLRMNRHTVKEEDYMALFWAAFSTNQLELLIWLTETFKIFIQDDTNWVAHALCEPIFPARTVLWFLKKFLPLIIINELFMMRVVTSAPKVYREIEWKINDIFDRPARTRIFNAGCIASNCPLSVIRDLQTRWQISFMDFHRVLGFDRWVKEVFRKVCETGQLDKAKWLHHKFNLQGNSRDIICPKNACFFRSWNRGHLNVCVWLYTKFGMRAGHLMMPINWLRQISTAFNKRDNGFEMMTWFLKTVCNDERTSKWNLRHRTLPTLRGYLKKCQALYKEEKRVFYELIDEHINMLDERERIAQQKRNEAWMRKKI